MLGQPIGNPAVEPLEFGPAHLHRDIVLAERGVGDEIQLDRISVQDGIAAHRLVDQSLSHVAILGSMNRTPGMTGVMTTCCAMQAHIALHESRA